MKNKLCGVIVSGLIGLSMATPTIASDDDLTRARVGISNNSFTTLYSGGPLEVDYASLNLGVTYITSDALYYDIAYKKGLSASWNTFELTDFPDEDYSRSDITLTVGKALDNGVQVFAGYQNSSTDIALPAAWNMVPEEEFNITGFFLGAGRSFKVSEGSLNLNLALGSMDAKLYDGQGIWHDSTKGSGYSIGATYTMFVSEGISANFELKQQNYDYEFENAPLTSGDDEMTMFGINLVRSL
jgi:hypothetical protein